MNSLSFLLFIVFNALIFVGNKAKPLTQKKVMSGNLTNGGGGYHPYEMCDNFFFLSADSH